MKTRSFFAAALVAAGLTAQPAVAADEENICGFYGSIAYVVAEYMLPLRLQDVVNMMTGKDPSISAGLATSMLNAASANQVLAIAQLKAEDAELFGEAAGSTSFQLLLSGQASSPQELQQILQGHCLNVGYQTIIDNQRRANAAGAANTPQ